MTRENSNVVLDEEWIDELSCTDSEEEDEEDNNTIIIKETTRKSRRLFAPWRKKPAAQERKAEPNKPLRQRTTKQEERSKVTASLPLAKGKYRVEMMVAANKPVAATSSLVHILKRILKSDFLDLFLILSFWAAIATGVYYFEIEVGPEYHAVYIIRIKRKRSYISSTSEGILCIHMHVYLMYDRYSRQL